MNTANRISVIPRHRGGYRRVALRRARRAHDVRLCVIRHISVDATTHAANGGGGRLRRQFGIGINAVSCWFQKKSFLCAQPSSRSRRSLNLQPLARSRDLASSRINVRSSDRREPSHARRLGQQRASPCRRRAASSFNALAASCRTQRSASGLEIDTSSKAPEP